VNKAASAAKKFPTVAMRYNMKNLIVIIWLLVVGLGIVGWISNIVKFIDCDFTSPYKCEVVHGIGIPIPIIGAITGWMDFGK
jgi:hypothetical protein